MRCGGNALDRPLCRGAEVIRFQLNRGETRGPLRKVRDTTVSRRCIRERNHACRVKEAVRRHQRRVYGQLRTDFGRIDVCYDDAKTAGQMIDADSVEVIRCKHGWLTSLGMIMTAIGAGDESNVVFNLHGKLLGSKVKLP